MDAGWRAAAGVPRAAAVSGGSRRCGKPVIACIKGFALGGGCELAMACTMRIASEAARLGQPEIKLGLIPGYGGSQRLPRLVGKGAALKMLLTGEMVGAAEALRIGLVDEVVPGDARLDGPGAEQIAKTIAAEAPLAVAEVWRRWSAGYDLPLERRWSWRRRSSGGCAGRRTSGRGRGRFWRSVFQRGKAGNGDGICSSTTGLP